MQHSCIEAIRRDLRKRYHPLTSIRVATCGPLPDRSLLRWTQRGDRGWLFPGGHPGSHAAASLHRKLKRHGLPDADRSRAAALISLAADLPAPILVDLLGLHINTATAWANHARADWATYWLPAAEPGRDGTPSGKSFRREPDKTRPAAR